MPLRVDIQILRGLAVLLVVAFHLSIPFFSHGFLGVDAFFVISGFLMALLYRPGGARAFYQRRASRLLPAYVATVVATVLVSALVTLPFEQTQVVEQGLYASVFASNIGFWLQNTYFSKAGFTPLLHLWSLGVEMQFYLIVPLLAWLYKRSRALMLMLALGSLVLTLNRVLVNPETAFYLTPFRIWEFLVGAAVAQYLSQNGAVRYSRPRLGLGALVVLLLVAMLYPVDGEARSVVYGHPALAAILVTLATAGVLAFGLPQMLERSPLGVMLHKLGDWSYSVYLAHFPIIVLALYVPFTGTNLTPSGPGQTVILIAGIGVGSALLYWFFDRRRVRIGKFRTVGALVCLMAIAAVVSGPLSRQGYSAHELNILGAFADRAEFRCGVMNRLLHRGAQLCELTSGLPGTAPTLLFVGDSHADSMKTSFTTAAQEHGVRLLFTVTNDPLFGSLDSAQVIALATAAGADGVILHFASGNAERVFATDFIPNARAAGLDVAWLLPVPNYEQSVPVTLWAERDAVPFPGMEPINLAAISQFQETLEVAGVPTFDPRPILCPASCLQMDDQWRPYYFDGAHLTLTGARMLEPLMGQVIEQVTRDVS